MRFKALTFLTTFALSAVALSSLPIQAAPQILGLIASNEPVPMTCVGGTCTAELSAVCLQQHRATPSTGTVYSPANGAVIVLTVAGPDGVKRQRIEAALSFTSLRQYNAVKVSLPEAAVRKLGGGAARLSVAPMTSLIPVAIKGDPEPLSASEIVSYTGPLRAEAERAFRRDSARVSATRILNLMVNHLPAHSEAGIEQADSLLTRTVGSDAGTGTRKYIERAVENCRETLRIGVQPSLRSCLMYEHDYLSGENTNAAWEAMNPGS